MKRKEDVHIIILSTYDKAGGAAYASYKKVLLLRELGYNAIELVRYKTGEDDFVYEVHHVNSKKNFFQRKIAKVMNKINPPKPYRSLYLDSDPKYCFFGDEFDGPNMCSAEDILNTVKFVPNLVFVSHTYDFINSTTMVELKKKWNCQFIMSCADVCAYTAGCHVHWDCVGFKSGCENCPAIIVEDRKSEVEEMFKRKRKNIVEGNFGISYSNKWLENDLADSGLFNGQLKLFVSQMTDTKLYNTFNRCVSKHIWGIDEDKFVIMCGATLLCDERKGLRFFVDAMNFVWNQLIEEEKNKITIMIVGNDHKNVQDQIDLLPSFNTMIVEYITDTRLLSLAYQAADIYVSPSLEDAGPMMVADAMACGTPVVGFKTGFLADDDVFHDGENGFVCDVGDAHGLADGIRKMIVMAKENRLVMSQNCRQVAVEKLSVETSMRLLEEYISSL